MERETKDFIEKYKMISPGDGVLVALSGGADSVCLLYVLSKLKKELEIELRALHVHHGLRGYEADRDAEFARNFCGRMGITFLEERIDAAGEARKQGCSVEEAGRLARYRILEREAQRWEETAFLSQADGAAGKDRSFRVHIATAHHGGDSAETILLNLFRGSGLRGLGGIAPVRDRIIRPLLWTDHGQIMEYLKKEGLSWVEDSSNQENEYARNKIRNEILPVVETQINERAVEHILNAGFWIRRANDFFEAAAEQWIRENAADGEIPAASLRLQDELLQGYIVRCALRRCGCSMKDVTAGHVAQILKLAYGGTGRRISLPHLLEAENVYGRVRFHVGKREAGRSGKEEPDGTDVKNDVQREPGTCGGLIGRFVPDFPGFRMRLFACKNPDEFPKNQYTKWFDYDKIKDTLSVRHRLPGDFITLPSGGRKLLKAYMIDEKIPQSDREKLLLLAEGSHILWIVGRRISAYYRVTKETRTILQVEFEKGADSG